MAVNWFTAFPLPLPSSSINTVASPRPSRSPALSYRSPPLVKTVEDDLVPSLRSIKQLVPPSQPSVFAEEADQLLATRIQGLMPSSFDCYRELGVTLTSFCFPGCIGAQRLASAAGLIGLQIFLDDMLFDTNGPSVEPCGIDSDVRRDRKSVHRFWCRLDSIFRSSFPPVNPMPIERLYWDTAREIQRESSPEWFDFYADEVKKYFIAASAQKHVGMRDVKSYINMRVADGFGLHFVPLLEFLNDIFLPSHLHADPLLQQLTHLCKIHGVLVNDVYSFEKEATEEHNTANLIKLLMNTRRISFPQAARQAIEIVNNVTNNFTEIEAQLPARFGETDSLVYRYVLGLKQIMSMNCEWHRANKRYRTPSSRFVELRIDAP